MNLGVNRAESEKPSERRSQHRWWIYLAIAAIFLADYAYSQNREAIRQRQADEFWASLPQSVQEIFGYCLPAGWLYQVQPGDSVEWLARQAGLANTVKVLGHEFFAGVADDALDQFNPALTNRPDRMLFTEDKLVLPPSPQVWDFLEKSDQNPIEAMTITPDIRSRAQLVVAHSTAGWDRQPQTEELIHDLCVARIYADPRAPLDQQSVERALSFYHTKFKRHPLIENLIPIINIKAVFLNNVLSAAGIKEQLPENVGDYAIFVLRHNAIGGGEAVPRPFFMVYGNYLDLASDDLGRIYSTNPLLWESGTASWTLLIRPLSHEAGHGFIQPHGWEKYLTRPKWNFAHAGMGIWTMAVEMHARDFVPWEALDPRAQYVFHTLIHSQTTGEFSAYLQILRGVMRFEDVDKIAAVYDQFRRPGDPWFDELFAGESPWVFANTPYGKYISGRNDPQSEYQQDVARLRSVILPLMTDTQSQPSQPVEGPEVVRIRWQVPVRLDVPIWTTSQITLA